MTYPGPQCLLGCGGLKLPPEQKNGSPEFLPPTLPARLPRKACLRLWPLTSALGHNAQPVPGTLAQGLLGAGFGAGSQSEALTSQSSLSPTLWGWGNSCCPLGLNIVLSVMRPQCGAATLASLFVCWFIHSSSSHLLNSHSGPSPCWGHESTPSSYPAELPSQDQ